MMTDLTPLGQVLTHDGSYIHECIWITWKLNKSINQSNHQNFLVLTVLGKSDRQKLRLRMSTTSAKNYQPLTASDRSEELLYRLYQKRTQLFDKTGSEKPQ